MGLSQIQGVGFLIARFTLNYSPASGGTWTLNNTQDLRGKIPNITAGGGGGGEKLTLGSIADDVVVSTPSGILHAGATLAVNFPEYLNAAAASSAHTSRTIGDTAFNTTDDGLMTWNGTNWKNQAGGNAS